MLRIYKLVLTTGAQNLWDLIVASGVCDKLGNGLVSGVPNQELYADRCINLDISSDTGNGTGTVTISSRQGITTGSFNAFLPNTNFNKTSNRNSICLKDYFLTGSAGSLIAEVAVESV